MRKLQSGFAISRLIFLIGLIVFIYGAYQVTHIPPNSSLGALGAGIEFTGIAVLGIITALFAFVLGKSQSNWIPLKVQKWTRSVIGVLAAVVVYYIVYFVNYGNNKPLAYITAAVIGLLLVIFPWIPHRS
jgi:hypothetical protein